MTTRILDYRFTGHLTHPTTLASWTVVIVPDSKAVLGTGRTTRVTGTIDGYPFAATLMPDGSGGHFLSLNAALRKTVGKQVGEAVEVFLSEQVN